MQKIKLSDFLDTIHFDTHLEIEYNGMIIFNNCRPFEVESIMGTDLHDFYVKEFHIKEIWSHYRIYVMVDKFVSGEVPEKEKKLNSEIINKMRIFKNNSLNDLYSGAVKLRLRSCNNRTTVEECLDYIKDVHEMLADLIGVIEYFESGEN